MIVVMVMKMYKIEKLTMAERVSIHVGAVVQLNVNESLSVEASERLVPTNYATIHIRKKYASKGLLLAVTTPLHEGFNGVPVVVVQNNDVAPIELLKGEEVASIWIFTEGK